MEKNEVITLSSDEECDFSDKPEKNSNTSKALATRLQNSTEVIKKCAENFKQINANIKNSIIFHNNNNELQIVRISKLQKKNNTEISETSPEVVVLDGSSVKSTIDEKGWLNSSNNNKSSPSEKNHSNIDIIDIDEVQIEDNAVDKSETENVNKDVTNNGSNQKNTDKKLQTESPAETDKESSDQNLKFFTEFVEFCSCLETIPSDKARLTKKLMKRYGEADCLYIKSQEFQNLVKQCRTKVNKNNLYLIAKEVTDELSYRKKIKRDTGKSNLDEEKCQRNQQTVENNETSKDSSRQGKKQTKVIKKIIQKLDKLGCKIRELEQKEVDLSDEEESSYVQLQRYRERFWQIYTKLCKYTNEVADAERVCSRKICFTESKYPAINKCIENFLNRTKRFPDFSDIMKLLESQSASLGLPPHKESVRAIALEIFQQVGLMLQRRRKYDLWDSFCGFLDDGTDPAESDPLLDQILKNNFEIRIKKEEEIFQHFSELQEKERLEPEEVPDEEANHSPVESGNEDEKELEDIENSLIRRLDDKIKKDTEVNDNVGADDTEIKSDAREAPKESDDLTKGKETKNNYKNCKSLKWKLENGVKGKCQNVNSEDSNTGAENEEKEANGKLEPSVVELSKGENKETEMGSKNESRVENKLTTNADSEMEICSAHKTEATRSLDTPSKRRRSSNDEDEVPKKMMCSGRKDIEGNDFDLFEGDDGNEMKGNDVFQVHCCQIFPDNVFGDFTDNKKHWEKRKVFRDLTNVNRLMELHGRKRKMSGLYSPTFFHRSFFEFEKPSWKKRFKVSFKFLGVKGEKCALSQEDKAGKKVNADSGGDEKEAENNVEKSGDDDDDDAGNSFNDRGNGEEDNNEDDNKKNGKPDDEANENQHEEEDEEENENEEDNKMVAESSGLSFPIKKTEETSENKSADDNDDEMHQCNVATGMNLEKKEDEETEKETKLLCSKETVECIIKELPERKDEMAEEVNSEMEKDEMNDTVVECISELEPKVCITETELEEVENPQMGRIEVISHKKLRNSTLKGKPKPSEKELDVKYGNKANTSEEINTRESVGRKRRRAAEKTNKEFFVNPECVKLERRRRQTVESREATLRKSSQVDSPLQKLTRRNTPSTSDEERVKRFLLHSPSSISITPPRKLSLSKPPSQAALQALATLRNLKGISATIVRGGQPKSEDDVVVVGDSCRRRSDQTSNATKRRRNDLPVISSIQTVDSTTPKIVTVQGNVSGFENFWPEASNNGNSQYDSSSIRISNVWGSLPNNYAESVQNNVSLTPSCSFRRNNPESRSSVKKKTTKKTVEYVVLE